MKKLLTFIVLVGVLQACREEVVNTEMEKVQFDITLSDQLSSGRVKTDLPAGSHLLISLTDNAGSTVLTMQKVDILQLGESFITAPLELRPGTYKITDFIIANAESEILFATPKRGAPLAGIVVHPLPYGFGVGRGKVSNISMEVVSASDKKPEDFGYASFNIDVVNPWRIAVFAIEDGKLKMIEAQATISSQEGESFEYSIKAKTNLLPFKGDVNKNYTLTISKDGFNIYSQPFNYATLMDELDGSPLKVILEKESGQQAFALIVPANSISPDEKNYGFAIDFTPPLSITVDWGDGTQQVEYITDRKFADFSHQYTDNLYPITITGDLDKIWHFSNDAAASINTSALTNLRELSVYAGQMVQLDLTSNINLEKLIFFNSSVKEIRLPDSHKIKSLTFDEQFEIDNIDSVIENIYTNAVANNLRSGTFYFLNVNIPITSQSQQYLGILKNDYQWFVDVGNR